VGSLGVYGVSGFLSGGYACQLSLGAYSSIRPPISVDGTTAAALPSHSNAILHY